MVPDEIGNHDESFCVDFYLTRPDAGLARLPKNLQLRPVLNRVE
jgi:serine/threonine protein kinase